MFQNRGRAKADAAVANLFAVSQYLNEHPEKNLGICGVIPEFEFPLRLAVRREYPILANILDRALSSISQEEVDDIANHHLLFRLEGARRTALLHKRIMACLFGAAALLIIFFAWNYSIRREVRARRKAEADLRETNRSLEIFSHSISHDLRAPLRAIRGLSQALQEDYREKLNSEGQDYLDRMSAAARRMDLLLRDVLAYSQASRAEFPLHTVSLSQLIPQLISECPPNQQSCFHICSELPDVRGNSTLLAQCLCNLLSNAVKYVPEGRVPKIEIRSEWRGSFARIWIEDNGIGIASEDHQRIFKIFQRVESGPYQGTGIGLAVVAKGIERMGGTVGVESDLGKGSRFWIELPLAGNEKRSDRFKVEHATAS